LRLPFRGAGWPRPPGRIDAALIARFGFRKKCRSEYAGRIGDVGQTAANHSQTAVPGAASGN